MEVFTNKKIIKKICIVLIAIILLNTFIPLYSMADEDEDLGGKLFKPISKLFSAIGDLVIKGLQKIFIGDGNIQGDGNSVFGQEGVFLIRYSPRNNFFKYSSWTRCQFYKS